MASMFNACYVDPGPRSVCFPVYATQQDLEGLPPALLILAGGDSLHDEGLQYREMLEKASVVTECHEYPAAPHGFTYKRSPDTIDAWAKMAAFLNRYFQFSSAMPL
jgi:acetyl esterase